MRPSTKRYPQTDGKQHAAAGKVEYISAAAQGPQYCYAGSDKRKIPVPLQLITTKIMQQQSGYKANQADRQR